MKNIPPSVSSWTNRYFHQSAFDIPVGFPSNNVIAYLSKFKPKKSVVLYRGLHKFNQLNFTGIKSWTYDEKTARRYANSEKNGCVKRQKFNPDEILLDTTVLNSDEKKLLGYDYKMDDREVLVISK